LKFLVAPNAFKESLTSTQAAEAIGRGLKKADPKFEADLLPLSDGGPGLLDTLHTALGGKLVREELADGPVKSIGPIRPMWLGLPGSRAVVESSQAIGLELVPPKKRDALRASSRPLGQLLLRILQTRPKEVLIGLGGSATTDGGTGMARGLGWTMMAGGGAYLPPGGAGLEHLEMLSRPLLDFVKGVRFTVLCDVKNPLTGASGSARVFAPQKGASPADVKILERGLEKLEEVIGKKVSRTPGAGAAGGLGAGFLYFCGARLVPGAKTILEWTGFDQRLRMADWVITGEGRLDSQSLSGKLPYEVCQHAKKACKPCLILAGEISGSPLTWKKTGARTEQIRPKNKSAAYSIKHAANLLEQKAFVFGKSLVRNEKS
jgi:glycerate kinase